MGDMRRQIPRDILVYPTWSLKSTEVTQAEFESSLDDNVSEASSKASKHSDISRYNVTAHDRKTICALDHYSYFVTNADSQGSAIAHILDSSNVGNGSLASALPSVGG